MFISAEYKRWSLRSRRSKINGLKVFDKVCLVSPFLVLPCKFAQQHILLLDGMNSRWDRYLGMTAAMTQVPVPTAKACLKRYYKWKIKFTPRTLRKNVKELIG